jgi:carboxyl-terminal processing protease
MMKKRLAYGLLTAALALNLFCGAELFRLNAATAGDANPYDEIETFVRVLETVRAHYVDGEKIDYRDLVHSALRGMISSLDPHSEFMIPNKYDRMRKDTEGAFGGIGVVIGIRTNKLGKSTLTVVEPMEDTPAGRAGVLANDRIIRIEDRSTEGFTVEDAVNYLRGKPGSTVNITIERPVDENRTKELKFDLKRAVIKVSSARDLRGFTKFPVNADHIGYVRLWQFGERTGDEFGRALDRMESDGMKALVLDLRDNPGGLLDQAVEVCEKFLPRGQLIVTTEARNTVDQASYKSSGKDLHPNYPIAILVNHGSASASEIVAGCLQDLERAIVIGEQTFGKGSVQSILPLDDGSALRLTTAKYYTPSHKVIHEKGITPNIVVSMTEEQERLIALQRSYSDLEFLPESEREKVRQAKDPQLERALDLLKGILLYGKDGKPVSKVTRRTNAEPAVMKPVVR